MLFGLSQHLPGYLVCFSSCTSCIKKTPALLPVQSYIWNPEWAEEWIYLRNMRLITAVCSKMVLALAIHCWNCCQIPAWSSMVISVYYEDVSPKLLFIIHIIICILCITPVRAFYLGFLWGLPGVIWRSSSCYSFLSNCSTSWRASQPSVIHATVKQLSLGAAGSGTTWWLLELIKRDCCCCGQRCGSEMGSDFSCFMAGSSWPTAGPCLTWTHFVSMVPLLPGGNFSVKVAQQSCLQGESSGSLCWSTSSQNAGFLPPVVCLWFCFSGF